MKEKFVCTPNSDIAKDMLVKTIQDKDRKYSLHRLGVAMHVYADTWAHQNFAGRNDPINSLVELRVDGMKIANRWGKIKLFIRKWGLFFLSKRFPLGHGAAGTNPDLPYIRWEYINGRGEKIVRDNLEIFLDASDHLYSAMLAFKNNDMSLKFSSLSEARREKLKELFVRAKSEDENARHQVWLDALANGEFDFGPQQVEYCIEGANSFKALALSSTKHCWIRRKLLQKKYEYRAEFLESDWKLFHDAIQAHRFDVIHDILPKYGICAG